MWHFCGKNPFCYIIGINAVQVECIAMFFNLRCGLSEKKITHFFIQDGMTLVNMCGWEDFRDLFESGGKLLSFDFIVL